MFMMILSCVATRAYSNQCIVSFLIYNMLLDFRTSHRVRLAPLIDR